MRDRQLLFRVVRYLPVESCGRAHVAELRAGVGQAPREETAGHAAVGSVDAWRLWRLGTFPSRANPDTAVQTAALATAAEVFAMDAACSRGATNSIAVHPAVVDATLPNRRRDEQRRHLASNEHDVHCAGFVGGARIE